MMAANKYTNSFYSRQELESIGFSSVGTENVFISKKASIYNPRNVCIGDNVRIDDFCILSGKLTIGNYVHVAPYCGLYGGKTGIILEDFSGLSSRCSVYAESDDYSGGTLTNPTIPMKYRNVTGGIVVLKKHSIVGSGSTILPNVVIEEGASIGSMSLVTRSVEPWSINVGIPCKRIKDRAQRPLVLEKEMLEEIGDVVK